MPLLGFPDVWSYRMDAKAGIQETQHNHYRDVGPQAHKKYYTEIKLILNPVSFSVCMVVVME